MEEEPTFETLCMSDVRQCSAYVCDQIWRMLQWNFIYTNKKLGGVHKAWFSVAQTSDSTNLVLLMFYDALIKCGLVHGLGRWAHGV
jgi:hypothetical protein